ncbi:MAG: hypothetical protein H0X39_09295 [Actinobacteria bacterium]|nr:hypothetical protein [Actinomycetota bacterium]
MIFAIDWVAVSSIATAAATLVLALATFASVRSANRAARAAERSLLAGLRPLLAPTRPDDPPQKVGVMDDRWFQIPGGGGVAEATDDAVYLAIAVRNVGSGIAVLHGWHLDPELGTGATEHPPVEGFRRLSRDLYIAAGESGFWQGAFRDPQKPGFAAPRAAVEEPKRFSLDILYGDHELGQRSITRFAMTPREDGRWLATVSRHWNVDRPDPR